jgi:hypothetical protein
MNSPPMTPLTLHQRTSKIRFLRDGAKEVYLTFGFLALIAACRGYQARRPVQKIRGKCPASPTKRTTAPVRPGCVLFGPSQTSLTGNRNQSYLPSFLQYITRKVIDPFSNNHHALTLPSTILR